MGKDVDMSDHSHTLAYHLRGTTYNDADLYVMINSAQEPAEFTIQVGKAQQWKRVIDTGLLSPQDISDVGREPILTSLRYSLKPRSIAVLSSAI